MLSADVVNIVACTEHQRAVMELARDWQRAQRQSSPATAMNDLDATACEDGMHVVIRGFPVAALPVLTRDKIPYQLRT